MVTTDCSGCLRGGATEPGGSSGTDLSVAIAGQALDDAAIDIGSAPSHHDFADDGSAFNLEELKAASSNAEYVEKMNCQELSTVTAAAMTNFQDSCRSDLPTLTECLFSVLGDLYIDGVAFVSFTEAELFKMVLAGLRENDIYNRSFSEPATSILEWHLEHFLQRLRL